MLIQEMNGQGILIAFIAVVILFIIAIFYSNREDVRTWYKNNLEQLVFQAWIFLIPNDEPCECLPITRSGDKHGEYCTKCGMRF
jgi:hypothetical protein